MSALDKAKNKAQELAGQAKEKAGQVIGDEDLQAEGRADQAEAGLKNAGQKIKDALGDAKDAFSS
jgi:uncharacterized protein YjbJ (UPF0337 family)